MRSPIYGVRLVLPNKRATNPYWLTDSKDNLMSKYLTIYDAADVLEMNHYTVRRMIQRGDLKAYKIGRSIRIKPEDIEKALRPIPTA